MAALNSSSLGMLHSPVWLRRLFLWLLLTLLLTAAASYTHGGRYAVVPGYSQLYTANDLVSEAVPAGAVSATSHTGPSIENPMLPGDVHPAVVQGTEETDKEYWQRSHAPRGEPASTRTGTVDPPTATYQQPGNGATHGTAPPVPDLPSLYVVELSISRT